MPSPICGPSDWLLLRQPKKDSHKGDSGRLLIAAGSLQYHGSLILAILAAVRFCDLVYVYCDKGNRALVQRLKQATPNIIVLGDESALHRFLPRIDAILAGPGWEDTGANRALLKRAIAGKKPVILDAGAFCMLNKQSLHQNVLLTPHRGEFEGLFDASATPASVRAMAKKYKCTILCKGPADLISDGKRIKINTTHHVGMTKGGTGDVLAGLCAALLADHNAPFEAACAAAYLNGLAGVRLAKKMGAHYSSADLADELPKAARKLEKR